MHTWSPARPTIPVIAWCDSARLNLAKQLDHARRVSDWLRAAEYEYAARLPANGVRISDVYRTADDILAFLQELGTSDR
ncbi:MAG: hypothetical protein R2838_08745 [Caldilineaceae bacterium]